MGIILTIIAFIIAFIGGIYFTVFFIDTVSKGSSEFSPDNGKGWLIFVIALIITIMCSMYINNKMPKSNYQDEIPGCRKC